MAAPAARPLVGLLYNPAVPSVLDVMGAAVDFVEVIPDRLWYDFGAAAERRFSHSHDAISELRHHTRNRAVIGHGIGLSLPSAMPLDEALLDEVAASHRMLGYRWYSEHLSMFLVPNRSVPNAQAGMGLPVVLDREMLDIVGAKVRRLGEALGTRILLENSTIFSQIPDQEMTEPEFLNRLHAETGCGVLLDLHNLYANVRNLGISAEDYLSALDPDLVVEIHLAGGDELKGFYTDSHSRPTPPTVWDWARDWAPRFSNLAAITYEYHESYQRRLGMAGVARELSLMRELAEEVAVQRAAPVA
jgi:uncharacterized protein